METDGVVVIGPDCFADSEETVICWRGRNYYRPSGDGPPPRPERVVKAEALREFGETWPRAFPTGRTLRRLLLDQADRVERGEA